MDVCLGVFTKLMLSLGVKELKNLFNEIGIEVNTPAAELVSFSISSYYGSINEKELKAIYNDLKNNPVAIKLLRARVQSYVYQRNIDIRTKQKFTSFLGMRVQSYLPKQKM
ncbi:hypothetical protein [Xanthocytophaga agilis]|uniref:Uncharacterized protein n=1 Tax=Xanthocytophaga agilis TaxID=3048010 RepID=A0AAE3RD63_9BACT|nr:hypothetical protein [Xanthocytophaga agilis]MDJ1505747.1 hypothetical protein [Xanthocytophaga agilis]